MQLNFLAILPELFLLVMACITLLVGLFFSKLKYISYYLVQVSLIIAFALTCYFYSPVVNNSNGLFFNDSYILDKLALVLKLFIYVAVFFSFLYSKSYNEERLIPHNEYYVLGLLSTLGMLILVSAHNFLILFLAVELLSLPIYAMVALQRGKQRCLEAGMKYFIIGAIATGFLLYGISLVFAATKNLDLTQIANAIVATPVQQNVLVLFGLVFILAGLAFKLGAAPFHMWVPDVYDGAPSSTTLFLSAAPKLAALGMTMRILIDALPTLNIQWSEILIVIAIASIGIGNLVAIVQTNIKRMLAYSSIAHIGYMTLGLLCVTPRGYAAALFYMISYVLMTLGAFGMIALMGRSGFEANEIEDFSGLNERNPWLAFIMMMIMFSLAGIPPMIGFIAKVTIIEALIQVHLIWLAVLAVIFAIIGAYYYIRVVKVMYFESSLHAQPVQYSRDVQIAISLNGLAVLLLGIFPGAVIALTHWVF